MHRSSGLIILATALLLLLPASCKKDPDIQVQQLTDKVNLYERADFQIVVADTFSHPFDSRRVALNMILESPSGQSLFLPAYYETQSESVSVWKARFAPRETGVFSYYFELIREGDALLKSKKGTFAVTSSDKDGFLHADGLWALRFDSGKPFRGIGENVGWEARSWEDPKWTYEYLLRSLAENRANFFRAWMCPWNFPVAWPEVSSTDRYTSSEQYFNPSGSKRLDEVVEMLDSLGLYMMLALNHHGGLIEGGGWELNRYNRVNGGPAATPAEFFTSEEARRMFRDQLRYLVARWGYSTHIGAWEFFNEVDNAVYEGQDSILIPHLAVTEWHREMAASLKSIDPYGHIVTTSVSHREIEGLYALEELDLNQMHIYKRTRQIPVGILRYTEKYGKPFSWGEFGYEWDWNKDFSTFAEEMDHDYRTGLWYGLFHPTPILPMSWWWEFFDARNMTPYFRAVAEINDLMLKAGDGSFEIRDADAGNAEAFAVKCGETYFICVFNESGQDSYGEVAVHDSGSQSDTLYIKVYNPESQEYREAGITSLQNGRIVIPVREDWLQRDSAGSRFLIILAERRPSASVLIFSDGAT
jgi:hypothetical protein